MERYYLVKYSGPFGFIKPWTAVRDIETFSQQFLTPSIIEGIEKKLFPELVKEVGVKKILRHRLSYTQMNHQQEVIQTRGWNSTKQGKQFLFVRPKSVLIRGVMIEPILFLAFSSISEAETAFKQHICLCRNEDILLPNELIVVDKNQFDNDETFNGYELIFENGDDSFQVGYNRLNNEPMFGRLHVVGTPVKSF